MSDTLSQKNIPVSEISQTLNAIWQKLGEKKTIKACLFNLLIYEESSEPHTVLHSTLKDVASKYPCRMISVYEDKKTKSDELLAHVSADLIGEGTNLVAHDHIQIELPTKHRLQTPFLVLPHILPDLPIYLLWAQNPANDNDVFPHMKELANHIIFDSSCVHNIQKFSSDILNRIKDFKGGISDLNWSMLDPWRDLFRRGVNSPQKVQELASAKNIRIEYIEHESCDYNDELPSMYFQAWIASCLNWSFVSYESYEGNSRITYKNLHGNVTVTLVPIKNKRAHGTISSLSITSYNDYNFSFKQDPEKPFVTIHCSSADRCDFPSTHYLNPDTSHESLIKRVLQNFTSNHYMGTLKLLSEMES